MPCNSPSHIFPVVNHVLAMRTSQTCSERMAFLEERKNYINYCYGEMRDMYGLEEEFHNGVQGQVDSAVSSLQDCEKGDTTMFFRISVCCPGEQIG